MNVVNSGATYQIYGETVKTYRNLPPLTYEACFSKNSGFFLVEHPFLEVREEKIYGVHNHRLDKVFRAYSLTNRNFGIILSGIKGAGKSLFARLLAETAVDKNMPVILVKEAIPGIASFLSSIEQEVVVIFDEFEKTYAEQEDYNPQVELLSLFDGLDGGKKMFVITCNEVENLNEFFVNRPGRFHYHFVITSPSGEEVEEYMRDKLLPQYHEMIPRVKNLCLTSDITYDSLRAIAFELNMGSTLEETLDDLNIDMGEKVYDIEIIFKDGRRARAFSVDIDFTRKYDFGCWTRMDDTNRSIYLSFDTSKAKVSNGVLYVTGEDANLSRSEWDDEESDSKKLGPKPEIDVVYFSKFKRAKAIAKNLV